MPGTFNTVLIDARNLLCVGDAQQPQALSYLPSGRPIPCGGIIGFITGLAKMKASLGPDEIIVCWEGKRNFRYNIFPGYKAQRKKPNVNDPDRRERLNKQEKVLIWFLKKMGIDQYRPVDGEADDALYTLTREKKPAGFTFGLYSNDKDLWQLLLPNVTMFHGGAPDWSYMDIDYVENRLGIPHKLLTEWFCAVGGKENLPGIPGIGPAKATDLLNTYGSWDNAIAAAESGDLKPGVTKSLLADEAAFGLELGRKVVPLRDTPLVHIQPSRDPEEVELFIKALGAKALLRPSVFGVINRMAKNEG